MNYTELVDAAQAYADRYDDEVASNLDVFITMAESRINRVLKTREQTARVYTPTIDDTEYYSLPLDYAGMRDIQMNSDLPTVDHKTYTFSYMNPQQFNWMRNKPFGGKFYYTVIADQIQIFPKQDAGYTLEIVYYQKVPHITEAQPLNWLSDGHPDIYLSGIISEIESFVKNYEVAQGWDSKMTRSIGELEMSDRVERWSGSPMEVRVG